jgi:hypothetical protein
LDPEGHRQLLVPNAKVALAAVSELSEVIGVVDLEANPTLRLVRRQADA